MADFRETLDVCGLKDLGFSGLPWTYDNRKSGGRNVKVRLDRGAATQSWLNRFFDASVTHLTSPCSDHCPSVVACRAGTREKCGRTASLLRNYVGEGCDPRRARTERMEQWGYAWRPGSCVLSSEWCAFCAKELERLPFWLCAQGVGKAQNAIGEPTGRRYGLY